VPHASVLQGSDKTKWDRQSDGEYEEELRNTGRTMRQRSDKGEESRWFLLVPGER